MTLDRIFLDANILFSVAYGSPGLDRLWEYARQKRCLLFASHFVVEEAKQNLSHPDQMKRLEDYLLIGGANRARSRPFSPLPY